MGFTLYKHLEKFNENNKCFQDKKKSLEELKNDKNINDFIKDIINRFNNYYECENQIDLNFKEYGIENSNDHLKFMEENDEEILDYNVYIETSKVTIPDTETAKHLIDKFEQ